MGIFDSIGKAIGDTFGGLYHAVTGTPTAADRRRMNQAMNEQINFYKQQTSIAQNEIARKRDEQLAEKRRIEEKQIRSLRRNFRPAGFLESGTGDLADKLGA